MHSHSALQFCLHARVTARHNASSAIIIAPSAAATTVIVRRPLQGRTARATRTLLPPVCSELGQCMACAYVINILSYINTRKS